VIGGPPASRGSAAMMMFIKQTRGVPTRFHLVLIKPTITTMTDIPFSG
jgi:hypothetical protein